jgi:hypothetical protein
MIADIAVVCVIFHAVTRPPLPYADAAGYAAIIIAAAITSATGYYLRAIVCQSSIRAISHCNSIERRVVEAPYYISCFHAIVSLLSLPSSPFHSFTSLWLAYQLGRADVIASIT